MLSLISTFVIGLFCCSGIVNNRLDQQDKTLNSNVSCVSKETKPTQYYFVDNTSNGCVASYSDYSSSYIFNALYKFVDERCLSRYNVPISQLNDWYDYPADAIYCLAIGGTLDYSDIMNSTQDDSYPFGYYPRSYFAYYRSNVGEVFIWHFDYQYLDGNVYRYQNCDFIYLIDYFSDSYQLLRFFCRKIVTPYDPTEYTGGQYVNYSRYVTDVTTNISSDLTTRWYLVFNRYLYQAGTSDILGANPFFNIFIGQFVTNQNASYESGYSNGYQVGKTDGYAQALDDYSDTSSTALTIFTGILQVGLLPINVFLQILNFEVFGINISGFVSALLTISVVIIVIRFILGISDDK